MIQQIDDIINDAASDGFAGQVCVSQGGNVLYARCVGSSDTADMVPVNDSTLFQVSSVAKYLTAVLTLKTVEAGLIELHDEIAGFVPSSSLSEAGVTSDHLLSHRSGLGSSYAAEGTADRDAALAALLAVPFDKTRIDTFTYSNDGFDLLAIVLERIHDRAFEDVAREFVLVPAGMADTRFWSEIDVSDPSLVSQPLRPVPVRLHGRNYGTLGSQGLLTTVHDLVGLQHALNNGTLLSESVLDELYRPRISTMIGDAAYGSFVIADTPLGRAHLALGAEDWGDNAILAYYPDCDVVISVVTSRGPDTSDHTELFRHRISEQIQTVLKL